MRSRNRLALALLAILLFAMPGAVPAQEGADPVSVILEDAEAEAGDIEAQLEDGRIGASAIETARGLLEARRRELDEISRGLDAELEPLRAEIEALGPPPEEGADEAEEIAEKRRGLNERIDALDATQKRVQLALTRAMSLADGLVELRREKFTRQLLARGPSPVRPDRIARAWASVKLRAAAVRNEIEARAGHEDTTTILTDRLGLPLVLALAAFVLAVWLRRWLVRQIKSRLASEESQRRRAGLAGAVTFVRLVLPSAGLAMVVIGLQQSGLLGPNGLRVTDALAVAGLVLIGGYAFGLGYYAPRTPALRLSRLDDAGAARAYRWLIALSIVIALDRMLVVSGKDIRLTLDALSVINAVLLILGGIAFAQLVRSIGLGQIVGPVDDEGSDYVPVLARAARTVGTVAAMIAPLLALLGFYGASRFLFYPLVYSVGVIGAAVLIHRWADAVSTPDAPADDAVEPAAGESDGGLRVIPVIVGLVLTLIAVPLLAVIWGAGASDLRSAWTAMVEGFTLGEVSIAPMDFLVFAIVFAIGYFITRLIQGVLGRSVMPVLRIDSGAKSALLAGVGYVGVVIAALVAISTTGLDLSNLAIVAGALSVGIGFGLQNVVNNFVSGIILLIERPIKVGDWVEIGGTHGMVRRINVRSTQIQKFDRSTMFVPNADLISGTVTNWYHGAAQGQLRLPVGVAYGSDVRLVEKILLEVADAHPGVLAVPAPFVLFQEFGASSLDFELRGIMADVNQILKLPSELRFAIYERFDEEGIEIPFAQTDLTIRNVDELAHALGVDAPKRERTTPRAARETRKSDVSDGDSEGDDASGPE